MNWKNEVKVKKTISACSAMPETPSGKNISRFTGARCFTWYIINWGHLQQTHTYTHQLREERITFPFTL